MAWGQSLKCGFLTQGKRTGHLNKGKEQTLRMIRWGLCWVFSIPFTITTILCPLNTGIWGRTRFQQVRKPCVDGCTCVWPCVSVLAFPGRRQLGVNGKGKTNKRTPFSSANTTVDHLASLDLPLPFYCPSIPFHNTPNPFNLTRKSQDSWAVNTVM